MKSPIGSKRKKKKKKESVENMRLLGPCQLLLLATLSFNKKTLVKELLSTQSKVKLSYTSSLTRSPSYSMEISLEIILAGFFLSLIPFGTNQSSFDYKLGRGLGRLAIRDALEV